MLRLLAPLGIAAVLAASDSQPHDHQGKLTPYQIGPPSLLLSSSDEARLQSGKAVMQAIVSDDAQSRRLIMVQDIPAPSSIVMGSATPSPPPEAPCATARAMTRALGAVPGALWTLTTTTAWFPELTPA
jgi:hypothetical protein